MYIHRLNMYTQRLSTACCDISVSWAVYPKSPTFHEKNPIFCQKSPTFKEKTPVFHEKSLKFCSKSPIFYYKELYFLWKSLMRINIDLRLCAGVPATTVYRGWAVQRALHVMKRALYSIIRALHVMKRALIFHNKSPTFYLKSPTCFEKGPIFYNKSPTFYPKSPTCYQQSPICIYTMTLTFVCMQMWRGRAVQRALHALNSALFSMKRALCV